MPDCMKGGRMSRLSFVECRCVRVSIRHAHTGPHDVEAIASWSGKTSLPWRIPFACFMA